MCIRDRRRASRRAVLAAAAAQEPPLTAEEERTLRSAVMRLHVNTGHPSNDLLARANRVPGGSQRSTGTALNLHRE
eukprot:9281409-Pyramimonas_sp.AAC.1